MPELAWEKVWHGAESAGAFVGADVAQWLIDSIKADVHALTNGAEYVTSYDILTAWFLKAAYSDEPESRPGINGVMCVREPVSRASGLSLTSPELPLCSIWLYVQHWPAPAQTSLIDLALLHHRTLDKQRTVEQISSAHTYLKACAARGETCPFFFATGRDAYIVTDQSKTGLANSIDWGNGAGKKQALAVNFREPLERVIALNRVEHGYTWQSLMRPSRWAAVRKELVKLQAAYEKATGKGHK